MGTDRQSPASTLYCPAVNHPTTARRWPRHTLNSHLGCNHSPAVTHLGWASYSRTPLMRVPPFDGRLPEDRRGLGPPRAPWRLSIQPPSPAANEEQWAITTSPLYTLLIPQVPSSVHDTLLLVFRLSVFRRSHRTSWLLPTSQKVPRLRPLVPHDASRCPLNNTSRPASASASFTPLHCSALHCPLPGSRRPR